MLEFIAEDGRSIKQEQHRVEHWGDRQSVQVRGGYRYDDEMGSKRPKEGNFRKQSEISIPTLAILKTGQTITTEIIYKICKA